MTPEINNPNQEAIKASPTVDIFKNLDSLWTNADLNFSESNECIDDSFIVYEEVSSKEPWWASLDVFNTRLNLENVA